MYFFLDKVEDGGWARLEREDGKSFDVPRDWLPEAASEGEVASQGQASRVPPKLKSPWKDDMTGLA